MKILYILSALGVIAMLAEIFRFKKFLLPIVLVGLLGAIACAIKDWNTDIHYYNNMLTFNNYALLFSCVIIGTAFLWFMMAGNFFKEESSRTDHYALILFALIGAVILVSYSNMVMLFLGIEILSIPLYVLAGSRKDDLSSNEAALKYFLMGAFATGFLLFGIALLYGFFGTFDLHTIQNTLEGWKSGRLEGLERPNNILPRLPSTASEDGGQALFHSSSVLLYGGIIFMLVGLSFKVSAVPFHFWVPDVYHGAPTPVTAFMSSIVKTAAFAAFLRLFMMCFAGAGNVWENIIWIMAALTILIGNITAVYQSNVKRMLAYSSISHAGYMLLAILAMNEHSAGSVVYYAAAYSSSTIGAFAVLSILENTSTINHQPSTISFDSFSGLAKRNPLPAFAMTIAMLSLSGIPPLAGFFGKYYIFTSALTSGYVWLVLVAVLGSLIGVYYYFRIIIKMYSPSSTFPSSFVGINSGKGEDVQLSYARNLQLSFGEVGWGLKFVLVITIVLTLLLGIFPDLILGLI